MLAVILALLVSASTTSTAQIVNQSLIRMLSPAPVEVPQYGEPELMAAISGRHVVISSGREPGLATYINFNARFPAGIVTDRPSGLRVFSGYGNDTQIVRLQDGRFLLSAPGKVYSNGASAQVMWRSTDGQTWDTATALDSNKVGAINKAGFRKMGYCAKSPPGVGGFDRPELYAYPYPMHEGPWAFMTTLCSRKNTDGSVDDDPVVLFVTKTRALPGRIRLSGSRAGPRRLWRLR
ncbi:MAG: hypothetical protein IPI64_10425 [Chloracidobacterium sp.]|nr:hypothetical protein [Chloracidobacterium sp.]